MGVMLMDSGYGDCYVQREYANINERSQWDNGRFTEEERSLLWAVYDQIARRPNSSSMCHCHTTRALPQWYAMWGAMGGRGAPHPLLQL